MESTMASTAQPSAAKRKKSSSSGGGKTKRPKSGSASATRGRKWIDGFASPAIGTYPPVAPHAELWTRKFCYPEGNIIQGASTINFCVRAGKNEFVRYD